MTMQALMSHCFADSASRTGAVLIVIDSFRRENPSEKTV
jgi:hypothetical protein